MARARARGRGGAGSTGSSAPTTTARSCAATRPASLDAWTTLAGARRRDRAHPARHDGLAGHVPPRVGAREGRRPPSTTSRTAASSSGIGAGWFEAEHETYGFPFLTSRERLDELDRQLAEITRQWTEAPDVWPKPLQQPRPPIIVGGRAKPRTVRAAVALRRRVQHRLPDASRRRASASGILDDAAPAAGREPLRFSMMIGCVVGRDHAELDERLGRVSGAGLGTDPPPISGTVDEVVEQLRAYEAVGVERAMLQHLVHEDVDDGRRAGRRRGRVYARRVRLFVVRHAEAAPGEPDELRPLTDAGRAAARALASSSPGAGTRRRRARRARCCARARPPSEIARAPRTHRRGRRPARARRDRRRASARRSPDAARRSSRSGTSRTAARSSSSSPAARCASSPAAFAEVEL